MHKVFTCMNSLYPIFTKCINNFNLYGLHVVEGNAGHTFCMGEITIMNYMDIKRCDIANGTGVRTSLFVSGCTHHCKGCFNQDTWDFNAGKPFTQKEIDTIIELCKPDHIVGLTLLGGEPLEFVNQQGLLPLLEQFKSTYPDKTIWCYTGYDFEKDVLDKMYYQWDFTHKFLSYLDVLVDGEFVEEKKVLDLRFRGSTNQRILDVPKSLIAKKAVLWDEKGRYF